MCSSSVYIVLLVVQSCIVLTRPSNQQCSKEECREMAQHKVILAGATGETGKRVLANLLKDSRVAKVTTIGRREVEVGSEKQEHKVVDFDNIDKEVFQDHDIAICTLGTTRGKAGKEGFIKVDRDYVMNFANGAKEMGVQQFHLMSSQGANANAYFLYPQIKGEVENKVQEVGFDKYVVYRPSVILVDRQESRMGEAAARWLLSWADRGRSMSVYVEDIAKVMVNSMLTESTDKYTLVSNQDIVQGAAKLS